MQPCCCKWYYLFCSFLWLNSIPLYICTTSLKNFFYWSTVDLRCINVRFTAKWRWRSSIQSTKTRPGADCGSDHELLITKFRLKLKKVGKTIIPFRYDLNQIPYDYTVEVRNWFKGLDLIDRVPNELWNEVCDIVQETGIKTIPKKKKCKKGKMAVWEGLTNSCEKGSEKQRRKGKIHPFNVEFQRIARRVKKAFLSDQCKEIEENNRMGKTKDVCLGHHKDLQ